MAEEAAVETLEATAKTASRDVFKVLDGKNLSTLSNQQVGKLGESLAKLLVEKAGYTDAFAIQNASNQGIDLVARTTAGRLVFIEVKASKVGNVVRLSARQSQGADWFVRDVLGQAAEGEGRYAGLARRNDRRRRPLLLKLQQILEKFWA